MEPNNNSSLSSSHYLVTYKILFVSNLLFWTNEIPFLFSFSIAIPLPIIPFQHPVEHVAN